jgi:DNA-binding IclR family transcriptional regulator
MTRDGRHGIQSIEVGMRLLDAFAASARAMPLSALAAAAGMHPAKAHRYLVSLIRAGYIVQNAASGKYGLGPKSTSLGLAALRQLDVTRLGDDVIVALRDATRQTISMVVWANRGPIIVNVCEADTPIMVTVRIGSVLPLLTSANGPLFLAYLPRHKTKALVEAEFAAGLRTRGWNGPRSMVDVDRLIEGVCRRHMSRNAEGVNIGVVSMAAPVFDHRGELACSIALVGSVGNLQISWTGKPARLLADAAATLSTGLGAQAPADRGPLLSISHYKLKLKKA